MSTVIGHSGCENAPVPAARLARLRALGHDFIEARREGAYVFDTNGKRYLDAISGAGTFNLGRRRAELAEELRNAMRETDQGNFPMISCEKAALAERLASFVPRPLECAIFSVMRGEAMDCACKIARGFTGRQELVAAAGGWYGQTGFALTLSERADRECYGPLIPNAHTVPFGDIAAAERAISRDTAAFIIEPIQAENGCHTAEPAYLRAIEAACRRSDALLIIDETQTNFGRTGSRFAFESAGVSPDVLVLGEALGGGMFPIAATMLTQRVNAFMNAHPMIHLSTFGGSDLGCRVASKALEIYERDVPWRNAAARGDQLLDRLRGLAAKPGSPIRGVNGQGLLIALEFETEDRAVAFCRDAARNGLLVLPGEVARNCVLIRPGLMLSEREADELLAVVGACV